MSRLIDSFAVWVVCVVFMMTGGVDNFYVVGVLISLSALCACHVMRGLRGRGAVIVCFAAVCAAWPPMFVFMPVAACLCLFERPLFLRVAWVIGWAAGATQHEATFAMLVFVLCCVGAVLAWRTSLDNAAQAAMRTSRDASREETINLVEHNRNILAKLDSAPAAVPSTSLTGENDEEHTDPLVGLTERERQIATLVAEGLDNRGIAEQLFLSEGTVRNNISAILAKKQLKNRTQLAVLLISSGQTLI